MLMMCGLFSANAQETDVVTRFGIKVAPNLSWTRSDTKGLQSEGSTLGYSVGLLAEFPLGPTGNYRFSTGLFLTTIGGKSSHVALNTDTFNLAVTNEYSLRFVELPLTIKMMTNEIGYLRYYGQIGLNAGINVRARQDYEQITTTNGVVRTESDTDIDIKENIRAIRGALVIGGGVEYTFSGQTTALFGITYNNSIVNLLEKEALTVPGAERPKLFADYLELTLGVFF